VSRDLRYQARGHVFISYVREDRERVDRLQLALEKAGIRTWRDTAEIWPGQDWRVEIREAISAGNLVFVACFSENSEAKERSYHNEELILAVEQVRLRRPGASWLVPVRFAESHIPAYDLGAGRTLDSLQRVDLFDGEWGEGILRLVGAVHRILGMPIPPTAAAGLASPRPGRGQEGCHRGRMPLASSAVPPERSSPVTVPARQGLVLRDHTAGVWGVAFSADSAQLATACFDGAARV
jgi:TIR domain